MLIGEYTHTLDPKKRLALPSKFRKELGKKVVVTIGLDNCLSVYPLKAWQQIVSEKISPLSFGQADTRSFQRLMLGGAVETDIDSIGRVLIPDFLKDYARLDTSVSVIGVHNRIELWDESRWKDYKGRIETEANALAEKLGEIGVL